MLWDWKTQDLGGNKKNDHLDPVRPYRDIFFNPSGCGVPLYLFSMVWTRGIEGCRERDFDDPKSGAMIGGHGYCTQAAIQGV